MPCQRQGRLLAPLAATGFLFLAESVVCGIGKVEILQYSLMSTGPFIARL
jgi:hypothetical protein